MTGNVLFIFPTYRYVSALLSAFLFSATTHTFQPYLVPTWEKTLFFLFGLCFAGVCCSSCANKSRPWHSSLDVGFANGSRLPAGISAQLKEVRSDILKSILTLSRPFLIPTAEMQTAVFSISSAVSIHWMEFLVFCKGEYCQAQHK
ncbi:unnamed protein product [Larinioides sclopetarius]|uniref:Uncharacterized protein n=1 Tax=Larinioides sclopetarius TaxID=280406 RepID=A0AAV2BV30_9ARAC